uniref:PNPLA domain-containing protein n=1 Tax=Romanomermis culicivorax TaxID=13658 RepID=A0A915KS27_ROMCU
MKQKEKQFGAETAFAKMAGTEIAGAKTASAGMIQRRTGWRSNDGAKDGRRNAPFEEILHCLLIFEARACSSSLIGCSGFCSTEKEELESSTESVQKNVTANVDLIKQRIQISEFDQYMQTRAIEAIKQKHKLGKKLQILISLDGGGIRGLILTMILIYIEKELGDPI